MSEYAYKVLNVDGPNLITDKGCVALNPFQYADGGGASRPVDYETWKAMRDLFVAAPSLVDLLEKVRNRLVELANIPSAITPPPVEPELEKLADRITAVLGYIPSKS